MRHVTKKQNMVRQCDGKQEEAVSTDRLCWGGLLRFIEGWWQEIQGKDARQRCKTGKNRLTRVNSLKSEHKRERGPVFHGN